LGKKKKKKKKEEKSKSIFSKKNIFLLNASCKEREREKKSERKLLANFYCQFSFSSSKLIKTKDYLLHYIFRNILIFFCCCCYFNNEDNDSGVGC